MEKSLKERKASISSAFRGVCGHFKPILSHFKCILSQLRVYFHAETASKGLRWVQESEAELPALQLRLVETERKRRGLLAELKVQEKDSEACKKAFQAARQIGSEEFKSYQKELLISLLTD